MRVINVGEKGEGCTIEREIKVHKSFINHIEPLA
jgi:hypothetical protein